MLFSRRVARLEVFRLTQQATWQLSGGYFWGFLFFSFLFFNFLLSLQSIAVVTSEPEG